MMLPDDSNKKAEGQEPVHPSPVEKTSSNTSSKVHNNIPAGPIHTKLPESPRFKWFKVMQDLDHPPQRGSQNCWTPQYCRRTCFSTAQLPKPASGKTFAIVKHETKRGGVLHFNCPEGPSTQYLRTVVQKTIP